MEKSIGKILEWEITEEELVKGNKGNTLRRFKKTTGKRNRSNSGR